MSWRKQVRQILIVNIMGSHCVVTKTRTADSVCTCKYNKRFNDKKGNEQTFRQMHWEGKFLHLNCYFLSNCCFTAFRNSRITLVRRGECSSTPSCERICTADFRPVCGTDGVTYPNQCNLDVASCRSDMHSYRQMFTNFYLLHQQLS